MIFGQEEVGSNESFDELSFVRGSFFHSACDEDLLEVFDS